jgi:multiple sugar transport system substrate-binding protein
MKEIIVPAQFPGNKRAALARGTVWAVSKSCAHPEAAWKLLQFLTTKGNQLNVWQGAKAYPALLEALNDSSVADSPFAKVVVEGTKTAKPYPLVPIWPKTAEAMVQAMQQALLGVKQPEAALKEVADEARTLLKNYRQKAK